MKARWIGEGDGRKLVGRNEEWRGARKRTPEKQNDNVNSKVGLMNKKPWNVEMEDTKETKIRENDKPRVVLKKEPWAETKTTFATFAQPKATERETKNTTPSDEKKVTTTVRRKQSKTKTKRKEGNAKPENNCLQRGRIEERNDLKWKQGGLEKGMARNWLEGTKQKWRKARGNKDKTKKTKQK